MKEPDRILIESKYVPVTVISFHQQGSSKHTRRRLNAQIFDEDMKITREVYFGYKFDGWETAKIETPFKTYRETWKDKETRLTYEYPRLSSEAAK
jgi:hypothetical protein